MTDQNILELYWRILYNCNSQKNNVRSSGDLFSSSRNESKITESLIEADICTLVDSLNHSKKVLKDKNIFFLYLNITILKFMSSSINKNIPFEEDDDSDEYYGKLAHIVNLLYRCEKISHTQEAYIEISNILSGISYRYLIDLNIYYDRELILVEVVNGEFPYHLITSNDEMDLYD